jgi:hypothetical protein
MATTRNVTVIPATFNPQTRRHIKQLSRRKVAGYARVSTDSDEQFTSYEAQVDYYTNYIQANPEWEFVTVYTDATVIIGLKQNPTHGRRFSPIFLLKSGILWGKTQNATTKRRKTEYGMG